MAKSRKEKNYFLPVNFPSMHINNSNPIIVAKPKQMYWDGGPEGDEEDTGEGGGKGKAFMQGLSGMGGSGGVGTIVGNQINEKTTDEYGRQSELDGRAAGYWQGTSQGAQMGSSFGPWGMLIGAGIGGIAGGIGGAAGIKKKNKLINEDIKANAGPAEISSANPYYRANGGPLDNMSGYNEFNGNTHEQGGIPLGKNSEVETGEVSYKNYIFSDRLGEGKSTYASQAKRIRNKYKGREDDSYAKTSMDKDLNELMVKNEKHRLAKEKEDIINNHVQALQDVNAYGGKIKCGNGGLLINEKHKKELDIVAKSRKMNVDDLIKEIHINTQKFAVGGVYQPQDQQSNFNQPTLNTAFSTQYGTSLPNNQDEKGIINQYGNGGNKTNREPIITNNPKDPKLRAYNDSLRLYKQGELDKKQYVEFVKNNGFDVNRIKEWSSNGLINPDKNKKIGTISNGILTNNGGGFDRNPNNFNDIKYFDYYPVNNNKDVKIYSDTEIGRKLSKKYENYKKPVQPYKYQKEEPIYENQFTDQIRSTFKEIPKQEINQNRSWNFNNPNYKILETKDKTGKIINQEYYNYNNEPINKLGNGGNKNTNTYKQAQSDSLTLYNSGLNPSIPNFQYPGYNEAYLRLNEINHTPPTPLSGEQGINSKFAKPTMLPYVAPNNNEDTTKKQSIVFHPNYNQSIDGIQKSKFVDGGFDEENPLGYRPTNKFEQNKMYQMEYNKMNPQFAPEKQGSWITDQMLQDNSGIIENTNKKDTTPETKDTTDYSQYNLDSYNKDLAEALKRNPSDKSKKKFEFGNEEQALLASNIPALYNLAMSMKPSTTKFENVKPELLSLQNQRDIITSQGAVMQKIALENARNTGGGSGSILASLATSAAASNAQIMNALRDSYQQESIQNNSIKNQTNYHNNQLRNNAIIANEQNKAKADSFRGIALSDVAMNTQGYLKDKKLDETNKKSNQQTLDIINQITPNYQWGKDPESDKYMIQYISSIGKKQNKED